MCIRCAGSEQPDAPHRAFLIRRIGLESRPLGLSIRYDTLQWINVHSKDQRNLAHGSETKNKEKNKIVNRVPYILAYKPFCV